MCGVAGFSLSVPVGLSVGVRVVVEYFNIYIIIIVGTPGFALGRFVYAKHLVFSFSSVSPT